MMAPWRLLTALLCACVASVGHAQQGGGAVPAPRHDAQTRGPVPIPRGGLYLTDFRGASTDPKGGVYHVTPGSGTIAPVLPRLAMANGVALGPDGKELWATEFGRNLLRRVELADATAATPFGTAVAYHYTGPAPDSMRADADGNFYVAMYGQGRVLAFNRNGIPIGLVLLPGWEEGHNLRSTSMAVRPGTDDLYAVTSAAVGGQGATIFHAKAFASALRLYFHQ